MGENDTIAGLDMAYSFFDRDNFVRIFFFPIHHTHLLSYN